MGCIICNMLKAHMGEDYDNYQLRAEAIEEMCNDIAVNHPDMVTLINEIANKRKSKER